MATLPAQFDWSDRPDVQRRMQKIKADRDNATEQRNILRQAGAFGQGFNHQQQTRNALLGQLSGGVQQPVNEQSRAQSQSLLDMSAASRASQRLGQTPQAERRQVDPLLAQRYQALNQARGTGKTGDAVLAQRQTQTQNQIGNERGRIENANLREQPMLAREALQSRERIEQTRAGAEVSKAESQADAQKHAATQDSLARLGVSNNQLTAALSSGDTQMAIAQLVQQSTNDRTKMALDVQKAGQELQYKAQAMGVLPQDIAAIAQPLSLALQMGDEATIRRLLPAFQQLVSIAAASSAQASGMLSQGGQSVSAQGTPSMLPAKPSGSSFSQNVDTATEILESGAQGLFNRLMRSAFSYAQ